MAADPLLQKRLESANSRQDEFLARRVEAGDESAKRRRVEELVSESVPGQSSGSRAPDIPDAEVELPAGGQGGSPRAASSKQEVASDNEDMPVPTAEEAGAKRGREVDEEEAGRPSAWLRIEDPDPPDDAEAGLLVAPIVLMLGERRAPPGHPGRYDLCELFSPARVTAAATEQGLRGGWSLDLHHVDAVTGRKWDLSTPEDQGKVWKLLGRDKPLVVGLSPECTLFSQLQNLRKT